MLESYLETVHMGCLFWHKEQIVWPSCLARLPDIIMTGTCVCFKEKIILVSYCLVIDFGVDLYYLGVHLFSIGRNLVVTTFT